MKKKLSFDERLKKAKIDRMVNNLTLIKNSPYYDLFKDLCNEVSGADNYTEQWGGIRIDVNGVDALIDKHLNENIYEESFLLDCCLPVFEVLINHKIISIEGYEIGSYTDID